MKPPFDKIPKPSFLPRLVTQTNSVSISLPAVNILAKTKSPIYLVRKEDCSFN